MPAPLTTLDIIARSFFEIGAYSPSDTLPPEDTSFARQKLAALLDAFNADGLNIYATDFLMFTLIPNVQPLLIGEAVNVTQVAAAANVATYTGVNNYQVGDIVSIGGIGTIGGVLFNQSNVIVTNATATSFQTAIGAGTVAPTAVVGMAIYGTVLNEFPNYATPYPRPVGISDANIVLNNVNPIVRTPVRVRDKDWWMANSVRNVPSSIPTDLYYDPVFPNGRLNLWPEQDTNYLIELQVFQELANLPSLTSQFYMPQGYQDFVAYSLAEALCPTYGKELSATARNLYNKAVQRVQQNNSVVPKIATRDYGIPMGRSKGTVFNWLNGTVQPPRR